MRREREGDQSVTLTTGKAGTADLLIDIGGTNVRIAALTAAGVSDLRRYDTRSLASVQPAIRDYLDHAGAPSLGRIFVGVAGPVSDGRARLTNGAMEISADALKSEYGLSAAVILNDLEALGHNLRDADAFSSVALTPATPVTGASSVAVWPGTGLGVAAYLRRASGEAVVSTEAGHVRAAPASPVEFALCEYFLRDRDYLSAEDLLAGPGLQRLYAGLQAIEGDGEREPPPSREVAADAIAHRDARARRAAEIYCAMFGSYCGDMAAVFLARGGVYIGGTVVGALAPMIGETELVARFLNRGLMSALMQEIPLRMPVLDEPVLCGLAVYAHGLDNAAAPSA